MRLAELIKVVPGAVLEVGETENPEVSSIECDSRRVTDGSVFVAIRGGQERDRHQFVADAVARGAAAVVVEENDVPSGGAARIRVRNCRLALAELGAWVNGYPAAHLCTVGVTGTNGKTTTALLVRRILEAARISCGYVGTLGAQVGDDMEDLANTTPEASELHDLLRRMVDGGRDAVVLEVSSHALALERVAGIEFDAVIFTNLTRDHLDFHGSEAAYWEAKARVFERLHCCGTARAVVNLDDPVSSLLLERAAGRSITFGRHMEADVRLLEAIDTDSGTDIRLHTGSGDFEVSTRLTGEFNCSNVMAAVACAFGLGIGRKAVCLGLASLDNVPGRLEAVDEGQGFHVLVDYAHTPAGLETVLLAARKVTRERLICLFGCGGDRDVGKRPLMGRIASKLADVVMLTSDNPRSESPKNIIADITAGMKCRDALSHVDRREAIFRVIELARAGDTVVIAGKGDESHQVFADRAVRFDDREVAREALHGRLSRA
jgi:UDP-N-acetylmuramyl-tripeptide synthetase